MGIDTCSGQEKKNNVVEGVGHQGRWLALGSKQVAADSSM